MLIGLLKRLRARRCARLGHDWFPNLGQSEYLPLTDRCLRCPAARTALPSGTCLGGRHRLADHYTEDGRPVAVAGCAGPS